jgi:hypothetical protein
MAAVNAATIAASHPVVLLRAAPRPNRLGCPIGVEHIRAAEFEPGVMMHRFAVSSGDTAP